MDEIQYKTLCRWFVASKHVFCPCTWDKKCDVNCPHGAPVMSGVCIWCNNKYEEIYQEFKKDECKG